MRDAVDTVKADGPPAPPRAPHRRLRMALEWTLGLLLMGVLLWRGDLGELRGLLHAHPGWLVLAFVSTMAMAHVYSHKWRSAVAGVSDGEAPSWKLLYYYFFLARFTGLVAPMSVSDASVRIFALKYGHRLSLTRATYSVYLERSFDLIVVLVTIVPSLLFLKGVIGELEAVIILGVLSVLAGAFFAWKPLFAPHLLTWAYLAARRVFVRIPALRRMLGRREIEPVDSLPLAHGQALLLYVMSFLGVITLGVRFWFILLAVDVHVGLIPLTLCVPVAQLAMIIAITPGGLGILEAGWFGLFTLLHVPEAETVLGLVAARAFVMVFVIILYGATAWWTRRERRAQ